MRDLVSKAGIRGRSSMYTVSGSGNHSFKPQSIGEAGLRHPTGCTNELSQTKNTKMSESDLSNSELKKKSSSIIKKKSSSTIRKKKSSTGSNSATTTSATNTATKSSSSKLSSKSNSKSSSKLKKSKENIPDINVLVEPSSRPTSNTNQQKTSRSAAKVVTRISCKNKSIFRLKNLSKT